MLLPILLAAALAPAPPCMTGAWIARAEGRAILRLDVENGAAGPRATWTRPARFDVDDSGFSNVGGPVTRRPSRRAGVVDGGLTFGFDAGEAGGRADVLQLRCGRPGHLAVAYAGSKIAPFDFTGAGSDAVSGPWDAERTYTRIVDRPSNAEMTGIFDADQSDRAAEPTNWKIVGPADDRRRARTQALLDAGALCSGEDFYHAAIVFQHGRAPADYLRAHLLAMIATARGRGDAVWIASATLDRYLRSIGRPQVLGTQFEVPRGGPATQEPYDRDLASDAMREALLVPGLAAQARTLAEYTAEALRSRTP